MKKLAIIGASTFQLPLIKKAKEYNIETHVFAWECGDEGEKVADFFYPISITECEAIFRKCKEIGIDGICTIGTDLGTIAVSYVASRLGLIANSEETTKVATNKHLMRRCFEKNGDPSPKSILISDIKELDEYNFEFPVICKPTDRSGSRGIYKVNDIETLKGVIGKSIDYSFEKKALVEEFALGKEYSVEYITYEGKHSFLAMTQKYTTGAPNFIETGHIEPADVSDDTLEKVKKVVEHALSSLNVTYGASHSEIKIDDTGKIKIIEIGARMGGDYIGSHLVCLSTGFDFVKGVIDIALGQKPVLTKDLKKKMAGVRFIFNERDIQQFETLKRENPEIIVESEIKKITDESVVDSGSRFGYFLMCSDKKEEIKKWFPLEREE
ncbi:Biotin carboxylase [Pseudobutyrivibrio sp. AR14]|uniref:ATP-grasp domain-containing protein n=1 Tax=Pseudobutyrivibrio sp. AR14 TaxID=1520804 RepID=UPI000883F1F3|nr:ATP-grasp domain-containing protein [Pseudobutyrivibrio sp. AR14]SCY44939.1 Biotin carboxylase [Pseudobutyrivibrio sp. AR14]